MRKRVGIGLALCLLIMVVAEAQYSGGGGSGGGAPTSAKYVTGAADGTLSAEISPAAANQVPVSSSNSAAAWGTVPVAAGGTGLTSGTDGGVPTFTASGTLTSSGALTANLPVIGGGAGAVVAVGTRSGNTTAYVTTTGSQTSGDCVKIDANGNHVANGSACGSGSSTFDRTQWELIEEFNTGTSTTAQIGSNGLAFNAINTGTIAMNITGTAERPGLLRINSHATNDNSGVGLAVDSAANVVTSGTIWNAHNWTIEGSVVLGSNSTAITNSGSWFGLINTTSADPAASASKAVWIRRSTDLSDTAYVFQICNASGANGCNDAGDGTNSKTAVSTQTPSAGTFDRYKIRRQLVGVGGADTIYFSVNGETEKTFCASGCDNTFAAIDPTSSAFSVGWVYLTQTTTGVLSADIDWLHILVTGLSR